MIRVRYWIVPLAAVRIIFSLLPPHASAQPTENCKPELRAEGRRSDPGKPEEKEREARELSVAKWEQTAREIHGEKFAQWPLARDKNIECERYDQPGFDGRVSCVAIGLPCEKP